MSREIIISGMKHVPLKMISDIGGITEDLTIVNPQYTKAKELGIQNIRVSKYIRCYLITPTHIYIPRYFSIAKYTRLKPSDVDIIIETRDIPIDIEIDIPPYNKEFSYQEDMVACYNGDGILVAPPGSGKTIIGLKIINQVKQKTLVLTPTDAIRQQWVRLFKERTDGEILLIKGNPDKVDFKSCDLAVSSFQALLGVNYNHDIFKEFPFLIVDEVHVAGAPEFNKVVGSFRSRRLGLTATPYRNDKLHQMYMWHLGKIQKQITYADTNQHTPKIFELLVNTDARAGRYRTLPQFVTALWKDELYLSSLAKEINKIIQDRDYIIILCDRKNGPYELLKLLELGDKTVEIVVGSDDISKASEANIIISTWNKIKLGYNNEKIDTLIIASIVSTAEFSEQTVGRTLRKMIGKNIPHIYSVTTSEGVLRATHIKRMRAWRELGWT